jgi:hypothetical protein
MQIKWLFDHRQANDGGHVFIISVDGVQCLINEPCKKPSAKWYSHKFNKPGLPCIRDCSFSVFKQGHMGARSFSHTSKDQTRASEDLAALLHDMQIPHPQAAAAAASAAYPHWQDSEAETLLKNDIAAGIGTTDDQAQAAVELAQRVSSISLDCIPKAHPPRATCGA